MRFRPSVRQSSVIRKPDRASPRAVLLVGLVAVGAGLYFMLVGLGVLPPPGKAKAPEWLVFACGLGTHCRRARRAGCRLHNTSWA
jgi:hypothetical protein